MKKMSDDLREKAALLGWNKKDALALMRSARKYGGIEECLEAFRKAIREKGGEGIEKEMVPTVRAFGNVRDLSLLLYLGFFEAHIVDPKDGKKIKDSTQRFSVEEKCEHLTYLRCYSAMRSFSHILQESSGIYYTAAYSLARNIANYEALTIIPKYSTILLNLIPKDNTDEALKCIKRMSDELNEATGLYGDFEVDREKYELKTQKIEELFQIVKDGAETANLCMRDYKTMLMTVYKWAEEHNATDFIPQIIIDNRKDMEHGKGIVLLNDKWLMSDLKEREERGEQITEEDRRRAIVANYSDTETYQRVIDFTNKKLDFFYEKG